MELLLTLHNLTRWLVLIAAIYVVIRMLGGVFKQKGWIGPDTTAGRIFVSLMDIQLLLGLALYVVGPTMQVVYKVGFGAAMKDSSLRFFAVEHLMIMLLAVVFAHLGSALSKRASASVGRFRTASLWYSLSLVAMLIGIPWVQRPLLRVFSLVVGA